MVESACSIICGGQRCGDEVPGFGRCMCKCRTGHLLCLGPFETGLS
jgi:hypothetical protein